jgi:type I restriction-modification system DNA methylase subunit
MPTYYHNEILFSEIYLEEITRQAENADVLASLKVLGEYREYADTHNLKAWKESYVHEVLSALGFFAQSKSDHLTHLFSMGSVGKENPLSLCYVILPEENLDNTTIGRNWAEKVIRALRENNLQWGLLTNGKQWRIYHQDEPTPYETYLEIDLEAILKEKAKEAYQIFHKFMKAENFSVQEDGKCQFDRFKKESQDKIDYIEKELANALRQREEGGKGVLSDLCMGYVEELRRRNEGNVDDEALRKKIYHGAMLYMFRLLFLFYADARGLLSDENHELLSKVEGECRTRHDSNGSNAHNFPIWDSLEHIFVDIDQTYNGGLFSPQESEFTRFLSDTRIGDTYLINVIFNLSTYHEKNGQEKPISYRDMSVRHLGTLYEGLLEHKLFIATEDTEVKVAQGKIQFIPTSKGGKLLVGHYVKTGEVYFAGDPSERRSTGSYYTPEYIVDYIVRNTLGEKLKELKSAFLKEQLPAMEAHQGAVDEDERKALSNLLEEKMLAFTRDKVLKLSVLDPAMGSGHFLVNATNLVSNFITEILNELDITGELESDTGYWRRWVVENCIYGVDINPLAVELAKLSLWILSMAKNQPLSFMNHHLKCGNSLVGAKLEEISNYPFSTAKKEIRQLNLFERDPDFKAAVEEVIKKSRLITGKASSSLNDVRDKKVWLEEIDQLLEGYKAICDVQISLFFGNIVEESKYGTMVQKKDFNYARSIALPNQYFHWELEFVEIFLEKDGFDVVIGNPPYMQIKEIPAEERRYFENCYEFATGRFNIFYLFIEKTRKIVLENGLVSYIVPDRLLLNTQCDNLRKWLLNDNQILEIISFNEQVFDTADVDTIILTFKRRTSRKNYLTARVKAVPWEINLASAKEIPYSYIELSPSAQIDLNFNQEKYRIIRKILSASTTLETIAETKDGIIQGKVGDKLFINERIDEDSKPLLFGENIHRYQINYGYNWANYKPKQMMTLEIQRRGKGVRPGLWMRDPSIFECPKILTRQTADEIIAAFDENNNYYYANTLHGTRIVDQKYNPYYILGVLNSKITTWFYRSNTDEEGKVFAQIKIELLRRLPIPKLDNSEQAPIINLVKKILSIRSISPQSDTSVLEKEIDLLIYRLYGLAPDEIAIIEAKG